MITQDGFYNTNSSYLVKSMEYNDYSDENKDKIEKILIEKRVSYFKNEEERKTKKKFDIFDVYLDFLGENAKPIIDPFNLRPV